MGQVEVERWPEGQVFESRDKREPGRLVRVVRFVGERAGRKEQYECVEIDLRGRGLPRKPTYLSEATLKRGWRAI